MKNAVFLDVVPYGSCSILHSMLQLLVTANIVPSSPFLVTLMMEVIHSSERQFLQAT
jgi:hypothetical protein